MLMCQRIRARGKAQTAAMPSGIARICNAATGAKAQHISAD
ncbi:hypothetical protein BSLA_01r1071 [Burkholderia stabilis]|nr:hypothetical protein BSLA_01r1071 [Burkholderia stabilis]